METLYFLYLLLALSVAIIIAQFWIYRNSKKDRRNIEDYLDDTDDETE